MLQYLIFLITLGGLSGVVQKSGGAIGLASSLERFTGSKRKYGPGDHNNVYICG